MRPLKLYPTTYYWSGCLPSAREVTTVTAHIAFGAGSVDASEGPPDPVGVATDEDGLEPDCQAGDGEAGLMQTTTLTLDSS
jgi:hypothetical protein